MKLQTIANEPVDIRFFYTETKGKSKKQARRNVACLVDFDGVLTAGYSTCHPLDNFNKSTGRRLSLLDALYNLPRVDKQMIVDAWMHRPGKKVPGF